MAGNICRRESNRNFEMKNTVSLPRIGSRHYFSNLFEGRWIEAKSKKAFYDKPLYIFRNSI